MRRRNWRNDARIDDGARDRARMPLFTQSKNDTGEIPLARTVDHIGGARAFAAHAHVERPVVAEREAPLATVKLHRGNTQIEHDTIDRVMPGVARDGVKIGK